MEPKDEQNNKLSEDEFMFEGVKGKSPAMQKIYEVILRVSPTNISVLLKGQSGTGKEFLARVIHNNSKRINKPFESIDCSGLTKNFLERELFGLYSSSDHKGIFEVADESTLFFDEIGDMPLSMQAKLLRILEDGIIVPVGSSKKLKVDVRIISATTYDLANLVKEKKFRQDLYYDITEKSISVPSLRERREDIPDFIDYFIRKALAKKIGSKVDGITDLARHILVNYDWPGNIRQLRNCIRTMVVMCDRNKLDIQDIPPEIYQKRQLVADTNVPANLAGVSLNELEKQAIMGTLAKTKGNREKAANILGIGERTLYRKIKEYNL